MRTPPSAPEPPGTIRLSIPAGIRCQLVYRLERDTPLDVPGQRRAGYVLFRSARQLLAARGPMAECLGGPSFLKACAKLCTARRLLYAVIADGRVMHHGWVMRGRCRYYRIEPEAVVIGPIWSRPEVRGGGWGTSGLCQVVNELVGEGTRIFYIDTSDDNVGCRRLIQKCAFGDPVAAYLRPGER